MKYGHYNYLASLFEFPAEGYERYGDELFAQLGTLYSEGIEELNGFISGLPDELLDLQELYTRTFDVQAITTLDIGYVIFGDDYKRAELLANLSREHKKVGNNCGLELGDYLPNILRLIPLVSAADDTDPEFLEELVTEILIPGLLLMIREFEPGRIEKKNDSYKTRYKTLIEISPESDLTIYSKALKGLLQIFKVDFGVGEVIDRLMDMDGKRKSMDFLGLVEKEFDIEEGANPTNSGCDS